MRSEYNGVLRRLEDEHVQKLNDAADGKLLLSDEERRAAATICLLGFLCRSASDQTEVLEEVREMARDSNQQIRGIRSNPLLLFFKNHPKLMTSGGLVSAATTIFGIFAAFSDKV